MKKNEKKTCLSATWCCFGEFFGKEFKRRNGIVGRYVHLNEESTWNVGTMNHYWDKNGDELIDVMCFFLLLLVPLHDVIRSSEEKREIFLLCSLLSLCSSSNRCSLEEDSYSMKIIVCIDGFFFAWSIVDSKKKERKRREKTIDSWSCLSFQRNEYSI